MATSPLDASKINFYDTTPEQTDPYIKAQEDSITALEQRYANPNWFNVAAGFFKPQLGGFAASLGSASEALGANLDKQRESQLPVAQMRAQLAAQKLTMAQHAKAATRLKSITGAPTQNDVMVINALAPDSASAKAASGAFTGDISNQTSAHQDYQVQAGLAQTELVAAGNAPGGREKYNAAMQNAGRIYGERTGRKNSGVAPATDGGVPPDSAVSSVQPSLDAVQPVGPSVPAVTRLLFTPGVNTSDENKRKIDILQPEIDRLYALTQDPRNSPTEKARAEYDLTEYTGYMRDMGATVSNGAPKTPGEAFAVRPGGGVATAIPPALDTPAEREKARYAAPLAQPSFAVLPNPITPDEVRAQARINAAADTAEKPAVKYYEHLKSATTDSAYKESLADNKIITDMLTDPAQLAAVARITNLARSSGVIANLLAKGANLGVGGIGANVSLDIRSALRASLTKPDQELYDRLQTAINRSSQADIRLRGQETTAMGSEMTNIRLAQEASMENTLPSILHTAQVNTNRMKYSRALADAYDRIIPMTTNNRSLSPTFDASKHPQIDYLNKYYGAQRDKIDQAH